MASPVMRGEMRRFLAAGMIKPGLKDSIISQKTSLSYLQKITKIYKFLLSIYNLLRKISV